MATRKTAAEKREEQYHLRQREWERFIVKLKKAETYEDAVLLHSEAVPHGSPGRIFYSRFGFFMHYFAPPDGASGAELDQYLRLLRNFDKQGALKEGALERIESEFALHRQKPNYL